jgi:diacylglycerol kinase
MDNKKSNPQIPILEHPVLPVAETLPRTQNSNVWRRFLVGFKHASRGLWYALRTQINARVHAVVALLALLAGLLLHISAVEFALIIIVIGGVFVAEMFNTAIELCVDLASPGYHPLAKFAKDVAAGAVLFCALVAVAVGLLIFLPHLWPLIRPFLP